jgi:hypothetical protein
MHLSLRHRPLAPGPSGWARAAGRKEERRQLPSPETAASWLGPPTFRRVTSNAGLSAAAADPLRFGGFRHISLTGVIWSGPVYLFGLG